MLSDDLTNLCRNVFLHAEENPKNSQYQYLMTLAGRLQAARDMALDLERSRVGNPTGQTVIVDVSDPKILLFSKFKRPTTIPINDGSVA